MRNNIPVPNRGIAGLLLSAGMRELMVDRGTVAQKIYRTIVAKRTGALASSARVEIFTGGRRRDRWCARLVVDAPYAASHEFGTGRTNPDHSLPAAHDLNQVLNTMRFQ